MASGSDRRATLLRLITGHVRTQCVYVAAKLGVVDQIPIGGAARVDEIAQAVAANADALYRVLRTLAGEGLFIEVAPRTFSATELGDLLRDGESSTRYVALMHGEQTMPMFVHMLDSVRTGTSIPMLQHGMSRWEQLAGDPEESEIFNRAMRGRAHALAAVVLSLDWSGVQTVVDVGGGTGGVLFPLLDHERHLRATLFDLPHLETDARAATAAAGLATRCDFVPGSFFEAVPGAADVYLLSNVLHDWDDASAARILATCRAAVRADSRLVVVESLIPPGDTSSPVKTLDMQMLVVLGGRERTYDEYDRLLAEAGFTLTQVTGETPGALEARPV